MKGVTGKLTMVVGILFLVYAAYSVDSYRMTLKLTQQSFESVPSRVQALNIIGVMFCFIGCWFLSGKLRPLGVVKGSHTIEMDSYRSDFLSFNTRRSCVPLVLPAIS